MSRCSDHHMKLTNGKGKCSVPMWQNGCPAGFCDEDAFGPPTLCNTYRDGYKGYVPGLACPAHGGPSCPGIDLGDGNFSGCDQSGGDCPVCGK